MTATQVRERISAEVERSQNIGRQIEAFIAQGVKPTDTRVTSLMSQREAALDEAERFKRTLDTGNREALLEAWRNQPAAGIVPNAVPTEYAERHTRGNYGEEAIRWAKGILQGDVIERNTLTVASDPGGGYTVPEAVQRAVVQDLKATGSLRRAGAPVLTTDRDSLTLFTLDDVTATWLPEVPTGSESTNPGVNAVIITPKKTGFLYLISEQLANDSAIDVLDEFATYCADKVGVAEDYAGIAATGVGNEPLGLLNSPDLDAGTDISGTTANTISNTIADMGSVPKIINMVGALPSRFHAGAAFLMHGSTFAAIRSLVDAEGRPAFPETFQGMTLIGYPVILTDAVPEDGTDTNKVIIFGNFAKGYRLVTKVQGLNVRVLNERYSEIDSIGLRVRYRVAGAMVLPSAFVHGYV